MASVAVLQIVQIFVSVFALVLHLIAISSSYWSTYYSKNDYEIGVESGHYGFWTYCWYRPTLPYDREQCYSIDLMFRPPPFLNLASILAVVAAVILLLFVPFAFVRMRQSKFGSDGQLTINRTSGGVKMALAISATLFVGLVLIFVSVRENELSPNRFFPSYAFYGFWINKNWAFYLEVVVGIFGLLLVALCILEGNQSAYQDKRSRHNPNYALGGSNNNLSGSQTIQPTNRDSMNSPYQPCSDSFSSSERRTRDPPHLVSGSSRHSAHRPVSSITNKPPTTSSSFRRAESRHSLQQLQSDSVTCTSTQCQLSQSFERIPRVRSPASVRFTSTSNA